MSLRLAWVLPLECLSPSSVMVAELVVPDSSASLPAPLHTGPAVRHHDKRRPKETRWKIKWNTKSINCNVASPRGGPASVSSSARLKIPPYKLSLNMHIKHEWTYISQCEGVCVCVRLCVSIRYYCQETQVKKLHKLCFHKNTTQNQLVG